MNPEITVDAIQRERGLLLLSNSERGWVTNWLDANGDECCANEAMACVGTDVYGDWYSVDLAQFEPVFSH